MNYWRNRFTDAVRVEVVKKFDSDCLWFERSVLPEDWKIHPFLGLQLQVLI